MIFKNYEIKIAMRYLRSKRKEGFISVVSAFSFIGIALGVATLIIVMSVMNGYESELIRRILGINGHVSVSDVRGSIENYDELLGKIRELKNVKFAAPIVTGQAMAMHDGHASGIAVRGMRWQDIEHKPLVSGSVSRNALEQYKEGVGILIGVSLANDLRVRPGDKIKVVSPHSDMVVIGSVPRMKTYEVVGTFDVGMYEYNASTVFMPLDSAQKLFGYQNTVSGIEIIAGSIGDVKGLEEELHRMLPTSMQIIDWALMQEAWMNALRVERNVMFLILTLIIIVAAFNVISSLIMLVHEKQRGVAILRTIGMSKFSVVKIFILSGAIMGVVGTVIGTIIGVTFSLNITRIKAALESITGLTLFDPIIYYLTQLPMELEASNVLLVLFMSLVLSFLATIYPAWKASKLMPAEALRYE